MNVNVSINGRAVPRNQAKISVFDNSLFYAEGLFETLLAVDNKPVYLEDHLDRLEKGAYMIGIKLPCTRKQLIRWINRAVKANPTRINKLRITVTAGDTAFWAGKDSQPRVIIIVTDYKIPDTTFKLGVAPFRVDHDNPFRNVKTLSFIIEMTSRKHAHAFKYDDNILLNRAGNVAETTSANIFWVKNKVLCTTPLGAGCLEGMVRKHLLEIARHNGIKSEVCNVKLKNLLKAEEIFVTSSIKLIIPVVSIVDAEKKYKFKIGPTTKRLKKILWDNILNQN